MKPPKIRLNGVDLESVTTVERLQRESSSRRSIGLPRQAVQPLGERLLLTLHPLTATQLYFNGVLPADRETPIQLRVGREKTTTWRIVSLETLQNRHYEYVVVFTLEPAAAPTVRRSGRGGRSPAQ